MTDKPLVLIWVLASELASPGTSALHEAAVRVLGSESTLRVQALPADGGDASQVEESKASAIAWVEWENREHRRALLKFFLPKTRSWVEREMAGFG